MNKRSDARILFCLEMPFSFYFNCKSCEFISQTDTTMTTSLKDLQH